MVYETKAINVVEIGEPTFKIANLNMSQNEGNLKTEFDLIEEREISGIIDVTLKRKTAAKYNKMVIPRTFEEGDFVLRKAGVNGKNNH